MLIIKQVQAIVISAALTTSVFGVQNPVSPNHTIPTASAVPSAQELHQLLAPIALYPDALVGQVLAGSTYPSQVVEAERWVQQNSSLKGEQLAAAADKQPWDPSIKALTEFPSVLHNMSQNLAWTSGVGEAYINDPQAVMHAIQGLRADAEKAGHLKSTPEQTVSTEGQTIVIQPSNPEVVYVPEYSPAVVYGAPIAPYPGYSGWDVAAASAISFGVGTAVGAAMGGSWGWNHWGMDWHGGNVNFNRNTYVSRSSTFSNRNYSNVNRATAANRNTASTRNFAAQPNRSAVSGNRSAALNEANAWSNRERQNPAASRGYGEAGERAAGTRTNAFSGSRDGGAARMDSARGSSSFGGHSGGFSGGGRTGGFGGGGRVGGGGRR